MTGTVHSKRDRDFVPEKMVTGGSRMQIWDVTSRYTTLEAWGYDRSTAPALAGWIHDNLLDTFLSDVPENGYVLDVGCGGGHLPLIVKSVREDLTVVGLDLSPDLIRWAKKREGTASGDVSFLRGDALELPFASGTFDAVLSVGSIKHWPDRHEGLQQCLRVLRTSGPLLVLEADREANWTDAWHFSGQLNISSFLRPLFVIYFKKIVAGASVSLSDIEMMIEKCNPAQFHCESIEELPLIKAEAVK